MFEQQHPPESAESLDSLLARRAELIVNRNTALAGCSDLLARRALAVRYSKPDSVLPEPRPGKQRFSHEAWAAYIPKVDAALPERFAFVQGINEEIDGVTEKIEAYQGRQRKVLEARIEELERRSASEVGKPEPFPDQKDIGQPEVPAEIVEKNWEAELKELPGSDELIAFLNKHTPNDFDREKWRRAAKAFNDALPSADLGKMGDAVASILALGFNIAERVDGGVSGKEYETFVKAATPVAAAAWVRIVRDPYAEFQGNPPKGLVRMEEHPTRRVLEPGALQNLGYDKEPRVISPARLGDGKGKA